jgi:hypothetical protein
MKCSGLGPSWKDWSRLRIISRSSSVNIHAIELKLTFILGVELMQAMVVNFDLHKLTLFC